MNPENNKAGKAKEARAEEPGHDMNEANRLNQPAEGEDNEIQACDIHWIKSILTEDTLQFLGSHINETVQPILRNMEAILVDSNAAIVEANNEIRMKQETLVMQRQQVEAAFQEKYAILQRHLASVMEGMEVDVHQRHGPS
eukprot:jgi/Mesvir1/3263/Mv24146-RA.1